ncbi:MAG TPA: hypothetical protein VE244_05205 [Nitrososphaeraceae archaeon]|nr:hypothetical protein [Nitrososphaeraceae archaeon]
MEEDCFHIDRIKKKKNGGDGDGGTRPIVVFLLSSIKMIFSPIVFIQVL